MSRKSVGHRRRLTDVVYDDAPTTLLQAIEIEDKKPRWVPIAVFSTWLASTLVSLTSVVAVPFPSFLWRPAAAILLVTLTGMLAHRAGGNTRVWVAPVVFLAALAAATERVWFLSAAAILTAVVAAVLAIVLTRPAVSTLSTLIELATAVAIATSGTLGVAAWHAPVQVRPFALVVLVGSFTLLLAIVGSLGASLHGVGPRTMLFLLAGGIVVALIAFYASFVRAHGSPFITESIESAIFWLRNLIGGVPRPMEALIGFPAIIVGTSLRSQHRQGWWVSILGVFGTMTMTVALVNTGAYPSYFLMSTAYSLVIGIALGLGLRWFLVGRKRSGSKRAVDAPLRVEPQRFAPLR